MNQTKIFVVLVIVLCFPFTVSAMDFTHKVDVDNMTFQWKVDGDNLHVGLKAKTSSWVGIGFNPTEGMKDANFILGYVKGDKVKITDHYGTTARQHNKDSKSGGQDNITNAAGNEANGFTEISFTIPLNSGDAKDGAILPDKENVVLLAYGPGRDSFKTRHAFKTALKIDFATGKFSKLK
jgi:hypothetical protein